MHVVGMTTTVTIAPAVTPHDQAEIGDSSALLTQAVRITTGIMDAAPRPGQDALHQAIVRAMEGHSHTAAQAPTGSGKSFAALAAAYLAAIHRADRTVLSTDSLALMAQLQDKDVPIVAEAAAALYPDVSVGVAFMKGIANYIDPAKVIATAQTLTATDAYRYDQLARALEDPATPTRGFDQFPLIEAHEFDDLRKLVAWACHQYDADDPNDVGDRHACPIEHSKPMWDTVSSSSTEADDGTRFAVTSKAELARLRAAGADIVVTNHSILAVQAALGVPVIVGSAKLGDFQHIIVDEAHTLPGHVRAQGAKKLSGGVVTRIARSVTRAAENSTAAINWRDAGDHIAEEIDSTLRRFVGNERDRIRRVKETDRPLGDLTELLRDWITSGKQLLSRRDQDQDVAKRIRATAAKESLENLKQTIEALIRHRTGWARWVEQDQVSEGSKHRAWWAANVSPIDVGFLLRDNLWGHNVVDEGSGEESRIELSVSGISATMPANYPFQAGMVAQLVKYPTPFAAAYQRSGLYIPRVSEGPEFARITSESYGRQKFDVRGHSDWAADQIVDLVIANGGSALILSATARDGKKYANALRTRARGITVHTQWDGGSATRIVREWREDTRSVLVGTKTMMTGVDAPGATNTLVIVDRVPRSPSNPLDDARVEQINERLQNPFEATRAVYAVDAALLLEQAVGRLIRTSSDTGLVVVLDPRMLKATTTQRAPLAYPEMVRQTYMDAVRPFARKMTSMAEARAFIAEMNRSA